MEDVLTIFLFQQNVNTYVEGTNGTLCSPLTSYTLCLHHTGYLFMYCLKNEQEFVTRVFKT